MKPSRNSPVPRTITIRILQTLEDPRRTCSNRGQQHRAGKVKGRRKAEEKGSSLESKILDSFEERERICHNRTMKCDKSKAWRLERGGPDWITTRAVEIDHL